MAKIPISGVKGSTWAPIRITCGAATLATLLELGQDPQIQTVLLVTEASAIRVSDWGFGEDDPITDRYMVIPANQAFRIPLSPAASGSGKSPPTQLAVGGDVDANAPLTIVPEYAVTPVDDVNP